MEYVVILERDYNILKFTFKKSEEAVSFMLTALENNIPNKSREKDCPLKAHMEIKEANDDEETV